MPKDKQGKEPGFWRGYVWGILTPPAVGAVLTVITVAGAAILGGTLPKRTQRVEPPE